MNKRIAEIKLFSFYFMRKLFKIILFIIMIISLLYIRTQIKIVKICNRDLININIELDSGFYYLSLNDIIKLATDKTCNDLSFGKRNNYNSGKANCIGYAQYMTSICNKAFKLNKINASAKIAVGYYYIGNININNILVKLTNSKFVKDHDYVEILDQSGKVIRLVDPCIYDYTLINLAKVHEP